MGLFHYRKNPSINNKKLYKKLYIVVIMLVTIEITQILITRNSSHKQNKINLLTKYKNNNNSSITHEELLNYKNDLLNRLSLNVNKAIKSVNIIKLTGNLRFGNCFAALNNAIFSCEILYCHNIIIETNNCLIKNKIHYNNSNITIELNKKINCFESGIVCVSIEFFFYYRFKNIDPQNRFFVLQDEIYNNIPKKNTSKNDLYIHIRSGDIFKNNNERVNEFYVQPPLCFYETIINSFKFREIFIFSEDKKNPIINLLLIKHSNIHYIHNDDLRVDISYLLNVYNVAFSTSSFITAIVNISKNLKILFEYNIMVESEKKLFFHFDYQKCKKNYIRIQMEPTSNYKSKMLPWKSDKNQKSLMINEKCNLQLRIIY